MPDIRSFHYKKWVDEFENNLPGSTVRRAFEKTENKFEQNTGTRYYSSFESFKASRSKRNKKK